MIEENFSFDYTIIYHMQKDSFEPEFCSIIENDFEENMILSNMDRKSYLKSINLTTILFKYFSEFQSNVI